MCLAAELALMDIASTGLLLTRDRIFRFILKAFGMVTLHDQRCRLPIRALIEAAAV